MENTKNKTKLCKCGCGIIIKDNVNFSHGHNRRGKKLSEDHKNKIIKSNIGKIRNIETRNKIKQTLKNKWGDLNSVYNSENYKNNRKTYHNSRIGVPRKEETKNKISIKQIENWNDQSHLFNSKQFRNKLSNIHKEIWKDPTSNYNSIHRSEKISKTIKYLYTTEDFLEKYQKGLKVYKNKLEIKFEKLLKKLEILSFKFVGDHSFWIDGRNPDFINLDKKLVIELFGDYWHGKEITGIENIDHELDRINHYKKNGYKAIVIWEHELKPSNEFIIFNKIFELLKG